MYVLLILMTIIVGCAPKVNKTFVLEMPITYEEEKKVADKYPVEPVEIKVTPSIWLARFANDEVLSTA